MVWSYALVCVTMLLRSVAGYIAGVFCAIVSHPADTIVSKLNQDKGSNFVQSAKSLGLAGTFKAFTMPLIVSCL